MGRFFGALSGGILAVTCLVFSQQELQAEEVERDGFLIGFNLGAGHQRDTDLSYFGPKFDFYMGGSLTKEIALLGVMQGVLDTKHVEGVELTTYSGTMAPAIQYSHSSGFVIRGGVGYAFKGVSIRGSQTGSETDLSRANGFGAVIAPAYEIYRSGRFAIEANANFTPHLFKSKDGGFEFMAGGGIGFTWY